MLQILIVIFCATKSSIKAQFQHVYTHTKFKKVQVQFREKMNYIARSKYYLLGIKAYKVLEQVANSIFNSKIRCQCSLFESKGKLFHHSLCVLSFQQEDKNLKNKHRDIKSSHDESLLEPRYKRFDELVFR
ncbi:hypothetical protein Ahy_B06g083260 [Arachis hypogaea]|uniref:Protein FAR1-RELATED SEQUENCE n=1 Tax=Arachis hypogaea TaxID=3818 RepID=A0A444YPR9_ARAHY|nr:hypothetical protein Ahy_B06g083260 [Arachis hypogaea]